MRKWKSRTLTKKMSLQCEDPAEDIDHNILKMSYILKTIIKSVKDPYRLSLPYPISRVSKNLKEKRKFLIQVEKKFFPSYYKCLSLVPIASPPPFDTSPMTLQFHLCLLFSFSASMLDLNFIILPLSVSLFVSSSLSELVYASGVLLQLLV